MKKWNIHVDHPWAKCVQEDGAPYRIYILTPKVFITIGLGPGQGSQIYDWKTKKWADRYSWMDGERSFKHSHILGEHMDPKLGAEKHSHYNPMVLIYIHYKGYDRD